MYEKQTKSKRWRQTEMLFDKVFGSEKAYDQLYKKHFKTHYAGKPTKQYLKLMEQIHESDQFTQNDIERLLLS